MTPRQKLIAVIGVAVLLFIVFMRTADSREKTIYGRDTDGQRVDLTFDLAESAEDRERFRDLFSEQPGVQQCINNADFAADLVRDRDAGATEQSRLQQMRDRYEASFEDPAGAISRHIYVDFLRMVRDVYRRDRSGYAITDPNVAWEREIWWCTLCGFHRDTGPRGCGY